MSSIIIIFNSRQLMKFNKIITEKTGVSTSLVSFCLE